jgi:hypothetical protein
VSDLEGIAEALRRQREDLERQFDDTDMSSIETSRLLEKLEALRKRMERGQSTPATTDDDPARPRTS